MIRSLLFVFRGLHAAALLGVAVWRIGLLSLEVASLRQAREAAADRERRLVADLAMWRRRAHRVEGEWAEHIEACADRRADVADLEAAAVRLAAEVARLDLEREEDAAELGWRLANEREEQRDAAMAEAERLRGMLRGGAVGVAGNGGSGGGIGTSGRRV